MLKSSDGVLYTEKVGTSELKRNTISALFAVRITEYLTVARSSVATVEVVLESS